MAKHQSKQHSPQKGLTTNRKEAENSFDTQLKVLLKQKKYRQAVEEIKKYQRLHPDVKLTHQEAEIWYLRGQWEFQKQDFKQAEKSFDRSLKLGWEGEVYYWQIRCLLALNQLDLALDLGRDAFITEKFPKDYSIAYVKLLLLKGDIHTVEQLIQEQSHRFNPDQIHWVRGVLDLKHGQTAAALASFQKITHPITEGDSPGAWIIYTQQLNDNWDDAANNLVHQRDYLAEPVLKQLAVYQQAKTGKFHLRLPFAQLQDKAIQEVLTVLEICQEAKNENYHSAAHLLLKMDRRAKQFPELETLRPTLLALAGEQAFNSDETECTERFWRLLLTEQPFNPQLAVNLLKVQQINDSLPERQHLINRFLQWLEQEGKKNPQVWPSERLKPILAHLHCWMADNFVSMDRFRAAVGEVQKAERILPTSPEVIARKGLIAVAEENYPEATTLLTQAIEQGCRHMAAYDCLLHCWEELEDKQAYNEARHRFGKYFGDIEVETEVEILPWIDALSTNNYSLFTRLIQKQDRKDSALSACEIFMNAVRGVPNSGGRVSLNQAVATKKWDALLQEVPGSEQVPVLQAITISIYLFAKREKGIAALVNNYLEKLHLLSNAHPEARIAYLVVLAVKENNPAKLASPLRAYLNTMPQPGNALANIQLQARCFGTIKSLIPNLEEALSREPQNPLLLLAKATTYPVDDPNYAELKQQGFELARRLQDAKALKAFRAEQAFISAQEAQILMTDPDELEDMDESEYEDFIEQIIYKLLGSKLSKAEIERIMPELKQKMLSHRPSFLDEDGDDEDDEIDLNSLFDKIPSNSRKKKGRTRGGFQELL